MEEAKKPQMEFPTMERYSVTMNDNTVIHTDFFSSGFGSISHGYKYVIDHYTQCHSYDGKNWSDIAPKKKK